MDHVPATFMSAGINVENCGFVPGPRGRQLARRFTPLKSAPSGYSTIAQREEWARLVEGFERALRLHAPQLLRRLADCLHGRTGGYIVSLSNLIREAAIYAIQTGTERIGKQIPENVELDHAAVQEAAKTQRTARQRDQGTTPPSPGCWPTALLPAPAHCLGRRWRPGLHPVHP